MANLMNLVCWSSNITDTFHSFSERKWVFERREQQKRERRESKRKKRRIAERAGEKNGKCRERGSQEDWCGAIIGGVESSYDLICHSGMYFYWVGASEMERSCNMREGLSTFSAFLLFPLRPLIETAVFCFSCFSKQWALKIEALDALFYIEHSLVGTLLI